MSARPPAAAAPPALSVVVPAYEAAGQLAACLRALAASSAPHELIVVDDGSPSDAVERAARAAGARYHRMPANGGPAAARNAGARLARGELLVFVDSDVAVRADTLAAIAAEMQAEPGAAALFGSYDDAPAQPGLVSRYRNLLHHFVHQNGPREASTFWAGCGAVRRAAFERSGGFDEAFRHPSIEDIELGMRLRASGQRVLLVPSIQCKHLKRWRLLEMVRVDVARRAMPWTRLLMERPGTGGDLNLEPAQKACVALVLLALLAAPLLALLPEGRASLAWLWGPLLLLAPVLWVNRRLYALFLRRGGLALAAAGVPLHLLYYVYGGIAWLYVQLTHRRGRAPSRAPTG